MTDYGSYSYWLETSGDDLTPRESLDGSIEADVAILGAGYTGLWTAWYLHEHDPSLKIVILERDIAGFGASGRNGGWCTSGFPTGMDRLAQKWGRQSAIDTRNAMVEAVDEIGAVAANHGLNIDWQKSGALVVARGHAQVPTIDSIAKTYRDFGFEHEAVRLDPSQTAERVRITNALGSVLLTETAVIHPGRLARGLARLLESRGVGIFEQTAVTGFQAGERPVLQTKRGTVNASMIALCGEAYLSQFSALKRQLIPIYSLITLTEPISPSEWEEIGWDNRECVSSCRYTVDYLSKTIDGRILFGGRGAPYHFGSQIKDSFDRHGSTHERLQNNFRTWFPALKNVKFTHTWGGPLGWPRDFMPTFSFDRRTNVATSRGYTGNGVATANLGGRTIAELMLGIRSSRTELPSAGHRSQNWEPEPFRFLGIRYVQRAFWKIDMKAERTGIPPEGKSLAERLTRH